MTGFMPEREFSRKSFVKGGGALVVGFSLSGAAVGAKAARAAGEDPFASNGPYDAAQIDSWVTIHADNTASIKLGKVELGQGSTTGLLMIAGEELDLDMKQLRMISNDTNVTPDQGSTAGSSSIDGGGRQLRGATAAARQALLAMAATHLGVPQSSLTVSSGVVSGGGKSVKYGDLLGDKLFNIRMAPSYQVASGGGGLNGSSGSGLPAGAPGTKPLASYKLVGKPGVQRIDIPAKITGEYTYVQNVHIPGMVHGRIVRPRGQGAYGAGTAPKIVSVDPSSIKHIPGAQVVQKGDFLGVVAPKEYDAIQAAAQLKVKWAPLPALPTDGNLFANMRAQDSAGKVAASFSVDNGNVDKAITGAAHVVSQTYKYHYNGHLPIGPSCCVADVTKSGARLFSNTQNAYSTRAGVQNALKLAGLDLPANRVRITYYEGSSVFGSSPQNDVAQSAAVMSYLAGKPVRLQFMRWDEHGWDNYGPGQMMDIRGAVDAKGNLLATDYTGFQVPYYSTEPPTQMLSGTAVFSTRANADTTNTGTQYNLANRRVTSKALPLQDNYFKSSYLRAPIAPQSVFGYEQMIDELAHAAGMDPVQFRRQNITNPANEAARKIGGLTYNRWSNVLEAVAKLSNWQPQVAAANVGSGNVVTGRGVALGSFAGTMAAIVADVQVNRKTGKILVKNLYGAQDTGFTVYPEGIENQAVGSMTQGLSRALWEEVAFDKSNVTSLDWVTYPILRFKDHPNVQFTWVQRTDIPATNGSTVAASGVLSTGSGEPPTAPVAAAVANAFFDATGIRIREAPMTPARVRAVLKAAAGA